MSRARSDRPKSAPRGVHVPEPMQLFDELPGLRGRLVAIYLDLTTHDLFAILGQIAVLGAVVDRAEEFAAQMREERTVAKLQALKGYVAERRLLAEKVQAEPAYIPPPASAPARRRTRTRT